MFTEAYPVPAQHNQTQSVPNKGVPRLPTHVIPVHYDIIIKPNIYITKPFIEGNITIDVLCQNTTQNIIFHGKKLKIIHMSIKTMEFGDEVHDKYLSIENLKFLKTYEEILVRTADVLSQGLRYEIYIEYVAELKFPSDGQGMYWDTYQEGNEKR